MVENNPEVLKEATLADDAVGMAWEDSEGHAGLEGLAADNKLDAVHVSDAAGAGNAREEDLVALFQGQADELRQLSIEDADVGAGVHEHFVLHRLAALLEGDGDDRFDGDGPLSVLAKLLIRELHDAWCCPR
jgi:hypothetical protein